MPRKYPVSFFLIGLLTNLIRYFYLWLAGLILIIVGTFGITVCLYIGLALIILCLILSVVSQLKIRKTSMQESDDPEFNALMDGLLQGNGAEFLANYIRQEDEKYSSMTVEDLKALSDENLYTAVTTRLEKKVEPFEEMIDGVKKLNEFEKAVYIASYYEMEVNNGGLCQFFVNSSREIAPFLSNALAAIGATQHQALFDSFVRDNNIDLNDLSSFAIHKKRDFLKQNRRYPFDAFDSAFYELEPLEEHLTHYIKQHITEF